MECKICNNKNLDVIKMGKEYYYCSNCELIFLKEDYIISPEDEKKRYEEHDNTLENEGYIKMFTQFIETVIEPYTEEIETVLDFGCGPGPVLANLLKKRGYSVDIYDPYFFAGKLFKGKKYDLITATEVFEHLQEPAKEIEMLFQHLKENAYLAIMTRFHPGINEFEDWWYKRDPTHITFYNSNTFKEIAEKFSLKIIFEDGDKYCLFRKK